MRNNDAPFLLDVSRMIGRRWHGLRPTGIDRICLAWQAHFGARSQAMLFHQRGWHMLPMTASQELFALIAGDGTTAAFRRQFVTYAIANLWSLARPGAGRGRILLNAGHTGLNLPQLTQWVAAADVRPVVLLHDIIPITHPQFCRSGERERHEERVRNMLAIAHGIVANSLDTLANLNRYATQAGLAVPPAIAVWPGTAQPDGSPQQRRTLSDEFVVLGTIEGRKNHALLLDVWDSLVARLGAGAPKLVIIGRRGWACEDVLARLDAGGFLGRVEETGPLPDTAVAQRLAGARALLFPSFVEGFGLPLIEALSAGVPVIASDLDVFREIGQGVPHFLPPDDVTQWTDAILAYSKPDHPDRVAQVNRLGTFRPPDWPEHFRAVEHFLDRV